MLGVHVRLVAAGRRTARRGRTAAVLRRAMRLVEEAARLRARRPGQLADDPAIRSCSPPWPATGRHHVRHPALLSLTAPARAHYARRPCRRAAPRRTPTTCAPSSAGWRSSRPSGTPVPAHGRRRRARHRRHARERPAHAAHARAARLPALRRAPVHAHAQAARRRARLPRRARPARRRAPASAAAHGGDRRVLLGVGARRRRDAVRGARRAGAHHERGHAGGHAAAGLRDLRRAASCSPAWTPSSSTAIWAASSCAR